jgi:hypothetical protein
MTLPDLSTYPASAQGASDLVEDLKPMIVRLWRLERESFRSDDLVAVINVNTNRVDLSLRKTAYKHLVKHNQDSNLIKRLGQPAPNDKHGSVVIWVVIAFKDGMLGVMPYTLVRS